MTRLSVIVLLTLDQRLRDVLKEEKPDLIDWLGFRRELDFSKMRWLGGLTSVALVLVILCVLIAFGWTAFEFFKAVAEIDQFKDQEAQSAAIRNSGLALAAMIGVPFLIWRSVVAQKQVDVAEQGQITDRINKAVEGLGAEKSVSRIWRNVTFSVNGIQDSLFEGRDDPAQLPNEATEIARGEWEVTNRTEPNLEVRIGAIYALERIAQDSDRDHVQIMEVLCAYIRQNAPANFDYSFPEDWQTAFTLQNEKNNVFKQTKSKIYTWLERLNKPREDVQAALNVIGRRTDQKIELEGHVDCEGKWQGFKIDLQGTHLQRVNLSNLNFKNANFRGALMQGSKLKGARLEKSDFRKAQMQCADLGETTLQFADFRQTQMQLANLYSSKAQGSKFASSLLQRAFLSKADLRGSSFPEANLTRADLTGSQMQNVYSPSARLQGAFLGSAELQNANFNGAQMQETHLKFARLQGANFSNASLQKADLSSTLMQGANLSFAQLQQATFGGASMQAANLQRAVSHQADFGHAQLQQANLSGASLLGAFLCQAKLDGATNLTATNLRAAVLRISDYSDINISQAQLDEVFGDVTVKLPSNTRRPNHWHEIDIDDWDEFIFCWNAWQKEIGFDPDDPATWNTP